MARLGCFPACHWYASGLPTAKEGAGFFLPQDGSLYPFEIPFSGPLVKC